METDPSLCPHTIESNVISTRLTHSNSQTLTESTSGIFPTVSTSTDLSQSAYSFTSYTGTSSLFESQFSDEPQAEINLISLASRWPRPLYRLRVDPCTAFAGYKHRDFVGAKRHVTTHGLVAVQQQSCADKSVREDDLVELVDAVSLEHIDEQEPTDHSDTEELALTNEQIRQTLDYFLLCGLRVRQMTHTYEDLEAMTHLLEEKQNDVELAAKIGKTLLDKNSDLETQLVETEKQLNEAKEKISHLTNTLAVKDNLLHFYTYEHSLTDSQIENSSTNWRDSYQTIGVADEQSDSNITRLLETPINFTHLNKKVRELEEENFVLHEEHSRLSATADQLDEHESALIRDCAHQLTNATMHIRTLSDELAKKSDAFRDQQAEITRLLTKGLDLENRVRQLTAENEMLVNRLKESQACQARVSADLLSMRDQYDECYAFYTKATKEVRALRRSSRRAHLRSSLKQSLSSHPSTPIMLPNAHESCSSQQQLSSRFISESGTSSSSGSSLDRIDPERMLGENDGTSLASDLANTAAAKESLSNVERLFSAMEQARQVRDTNAMNFTTGTPDFALEDTVSSSGFASGSEPSERPSIHTTDYLSASSILDSTLLGRHHMEASSHTSNHPQSQFTQQQHIFNDESPKRHSWMGVEPEKTPSHSRRHSRSSNPSTIYDQGFYCLPQRLQLIKPLDGSGVLRHWQRLATPSFTNALFEAPMPGVHNRAGISPPTELTSFAAINPQSPTTADTTSPVVFPSNFNIHRTSLPDGNKLTRQLFSRFGENIHSHLSQTSTHSKSMEQLRSSDSSTIRINRTRPLGNDHHSMLAQPDSSLFSLTSLVSALLPFPRPFSPGITPRTDISPSHEPIKLRSRSPHGSRGLLDVNSQDSHLVTNAVIQRITNPLLSSSSSVGTLPTAQPPPILPPTPRSSSVRIGHTSNLSEIVEESSPPS